MKQRGFTLLELLIVVVVVGVLASLAFSRYINLTECRHQREARDTLAELLAADQVYRLKHGVFTDNIADLPIENPNRPGGPLAYVIVMVDALTLQLTATRTGQPFNTELWYFADSKTRCMNETGWPCRLITDPGC